MSRLEWCLVFVISMVTMITMVPVTMTMTMTTQWGTRDTFPVSSSCSSLDVVSDVVHLQLTMAVSVVVWAETDQNYILSTEVIDSFVYLYLECKESLNTTEFALII